MKYLILIIAILIPNTVKAADINIMALAYAESGGNILARSTDGFKSVGLYQITPPVLTDYNRAKKTKFTQTDLYNPLVSRNIAIWYLDWIENQLPVALRTDQNILIAWNRGLKKWRKWVKDGMLYDQLPRATKILLINYKKGLLIF